MRNIYVDPVTYDLILDNRNLRMTTTLTEWLSAKIESRLKIFYGEWFANQTIGVPYFEQILKKQADIDNVQVIFSDVIKATYGVKELLSFTVVYSITTRLYEYTFEVLADQDILVSGGSTL